MSLFRLDASIHPATSASRALGDIIEGEWSAAHPGAPVVRRDLAQTPVTSETWALAVGAGQVAEAHRDEAERDAVALATTFADELVAAEAFVFDVPLYNFGVSQHFKTWFDIAYTDPRLGPASSGTLAGRPAVLATVLGGNYAPGTPKEGWDHSTGWIRRVLEDVWGLDLRIVTREFTLVGVNPALDAFAEQGAQLKAQAEALAAEHGRFLGETVAARAA